MSDYPPSVAVIAIIQATVCGIYFIYSQAVIPCACIDHREQYTDVMVSLDGSILIDTVELPICPVLNPHHVSGRC